MARITGTIALVALLWHGYVLGADIEEGKVLKYYSFDPADGKIPDGLPALTIEDLRKITLYSDLTLKNGKLEIADKKYMRRMEPINAAPGVLSVTSDHFRFTVLKNGVIDPKDLHAEDRPLFSFLWIKHVTHESPDGAPWLKDMLLMPISTKEKKLAVAWPLKEPTRPTRHNLRSRRRSFSTRATRGPQLPRWRRLKRPLSGSSPMGR